MTLPPLVPRALARLSMEERNSVTLQHPVEIAAFLQSICDHKAPLTVFYGKRHFFISRLFLYSATNCIIDAPPLLIKPPLQNEDKLQIIGTVEYVPFHFTALTHTLIEWEQFPAISLPTPTAVVRLQRRNAFRLMIPLSAQLTAKCVLDGKQRTLRVADISMGGIRLTDIPPEWLNNTSQGESITLNLRLDGLDMAFKAYVTNTQSFRLNNGGNYAQLCLRFDALPAKTESHLARFLMRQEVELAHAKTTDTH